MVSHIVSPANRGRYGLHWDDEKPPAGFPPPFIRGRPQGIGSATELARVLNNPAYTAWIEHRLALFDSDRLAQCFGERLSLHHILDVELLRRQGRYIGICQDFGRGAAEEMKVVGNILFHGDPTLIRITTKTVEQVAKQSCDFRPELFGEAFYRMPAMHKENIDAAKTVGLTVISKFDFTKDMTVMGQHMHGLLAKCRYERSRRSGGASDTAHLPLPAHHPLASR